MDASSNYHNPTELRSNRSLCGGQWNELSATISEAAIGKFSAWLGSELDGLVDELDAYVTHNSLRKSLRRQRR